MSAGNSANTQPTVLITGGVGFLGQALIGEFLEQSEPAQLRPREIRVFDTRTDGSRQAKGVTYFRGDICKPKELLQAFQGVDAVVHLAALVDWGQYPAALVNEVNLGGTRNVIDACRRAGVRALVFVSSLDAVYGGGSIHHADETIPYPARFPTEYCASKARAEQEVLGANGASLYGGPYTSAHLSTLVIRPCSIWGEGDPYHLGSMLKLARLGPIIRLGRDRAPSQWVYVGNAAHALVLATKALLEEREEVAGEVYFITDFPAKNFFDHLEPFVRAVGGRILPGALALPRNSLKPLSHVLVFMARCLRPFLKTTPMFTPFSVDYVCNEFTVESSKAARLLHYQPIYSETEAYRRTISFVLRETRNRQRE